MVLFVVMVIVVLNKFFAPGRYASIMSMPFHNGGNEKIIRENHSFFNIISLSNIAAFILMLSMFVQKIYVIYGGNDILHNNINFLFDIAAVVAMEFGVPVVFAKKSKSINLDGEMYTAEVESFTRKNKNQVIVSKKFLNENDHVLLIDDFLANGCALLGLIQIVQSAGATVEGIGIAVEKGAGAISISQGKYCTD